VCACVGNGLNHNVQGGPKKRGHRLMTIILSNLYRFKKNSLEDSSVNLQLNGYFKKLKSVNIWQSYKEEQESLSRALSSSFSTVLARRAKCMRQPRGCL